jgi:DNA/RNA endonuclease G (NUC1)
MGTGARSVQELRERGAAHVRPVSRRWLRVCLGLWLSALATAEGAEFTETEANKPETCRELWEGIGIPKYTGGGDRETLIVCHTKYILSHNNRTKTPDWVLERVPREQVSGEFDRPKVKFQEDPNLPEDKRARDKDYTGSKFDRGHQAPSDDFSGNREWMVESFMLSNAVPQVGVGFNRGIWKELEDQARGVVRSRGELYIITGPVYRSDDGKKIVIGAAENSCGKAITLEAPKKEAICGSKANCEAGVAVPAGLFKIIYDPKLKRANAFVIPNMDHREAQGSSNTVEYLKKFQTTVRVVERHTGLEFFPAIAGRERRPQVEQCATMMLH